MSSPVSFYYPERGSRDVDSIGTRKIGIMPRPDHSKGHTPGKPGEYRIVVQGSLGKAHSDRLAGMQITHELLDDGSTATFLIGRIRNQEELSRILDDLYEMHLPVLSVESLKSRS